jgi:hypothetical protein
MSPYMGDGPIQKYIPLETTKPDDTNPCGEVFIPISTPYVRRTENKMNGPFTDVDRETFKIVKASLKEILSDLVKCNKHLNLGDGSWRPFLAGGSIVMAIQQIRQEILGQKVIPESIKDYDIFFPMVDSKQTAKVVMGSILKTRKDSQCVPVVQTDSIEETDVGYFKNENVVYVLTDGRTKFQYIFNKKDRAEMIEDFDYLHCKVYYDIFKDTLHISPKVYNAIIDRKLVLTNPDYTYDARRKKFLERGYVEEGNIGLEETLGDILNRALRSTKTPWQSVDPNEGAAPGTLSSKVPNKPPVWKQAMDITK